MGVESVAGALVLGMLAGLGLAVPVGAVGALLIREAMTHGWPATMPGAAAVAGVDTIYTAAVAAGGTALTPAIARFGVVPQVIAGVVLIVVAVMALRSPAADAVTTPRGHRGRFLAFAGLTAINPATLVYIAAIVMPRAPALGVPERIAFTAGVGVASLGWHTTLVTAAALLRTGLSTKARRRTVAVGNLIVAALGVGMIVRALM
ncbi:LysE family transporter [Gordonia sp. NPDC003429]